MHYVVPLLDFYNLTLCKVLIVSSKPQILKKYKGDDSDVISPVSVNILQRKNALQSLSIANAFFLKRNIVSFVVLNYSLTSIFL